MLFIPETVIFVHSAWHFQGPSMSYNTHARQLDWQLNITRWRVSGESNIYYNYFFYKLHKLVFINDDFNQYILKEWVKQSLNNTTYTIRRFYTFENWKFTRHKKWAVMQNSKLCEFQRVLQHKIIKKENGMFLIVFITWKKLTMEFYIWELQTRVSWNCGIKLDKFAK